MANVVRGRGQKMSEKKSNSGGPNEKQDKGRSVEKAKVQKSAGSVASADSLFKIVGRPDKPDATPKKPKS